ncbi:MAG: hypothetical protein EXR70_17295 [Deltaproteobacteria bacterium]|nr:hypothetical protein [Deltaproteobacteria bacterium]
MKALSLAAIFIALTVVPANAGLVTAEVVDFAAQCGLAAARLITSDSEARLFPEENSSCAETSDDSASDVIVKLPRVEPSGRQSATDAILAVATLSRN